MSEALSQHAWIDVLQVRRHTAWLTEQGADHVDEVHAVFEQHPALRFRLEPLGGLVCVVLNKLQNTRPPEESVAMPLQHVAKPGAIRMVLVNEKQPMVVAQRLHERPRVLQPVAKRLLTNDVRAGLCGSQAVLAMEPRRREDIDEVERRFLGEERVQRVVDACPRRELPAALLRTLARLIDERHDLDFGNPLPAAEVKFRDHAAADDGSSKFHAPGAVRIARQSRHPDARASAAAQRVIPPSEPSAGR